MSTPATFKNQTDQIFSYQLIHRNHSGKYHLWRYQHRNLGERSCHRSPSESISCVNTSYLQKPDQIFSYQLIHRIHSGKYHHWRYKHRKLGERSCHRSPSESSSSVNTSYLQKPDQIFSYQLIQRIHSDKYHHWRYQHRNLGERSCHRSSSVDISSANTSYLQKPDQIFSYQLIHRNHSVK